MRTRRVSDGPPVPVVNSPAYWDDRFKGDWSATGGNRQTRGFMELLTEMMPDHVRSTIVSERLEVVDWGCAEGDGVPVLAEFLPTSDIVGVDISDVAVRTAREYFPDFTFRCLDLLSSDERTDVIVCSNVLEHFRDPRSVLERLALRASTFVIILVPFLEDPVIDEHEVSFVHDSFPLQLADGKRLVHAQSIDLRWRQRRLWPGMQLLAIYSGRDDSSTLAGLNQFGPSLTRRIRLQVLAELTLRPLYRVRSIVRAAGGLVRSRRLNRTSGGH